jgi:hypothetical protein
MTHSTQTISPLRQRMIDDMVLRKLSPKTQKQYIRVVKNFSQFLGRSPDTAGQGTLSGVRFFLGGDTYGCCWREKATDRCRLSQVIWSTLVEN